MDDITIIELKRTDLRGAVIIDGFPSVGLVSSIAANYIIKLLDLEQVAVMDSISFPTVSLVRDGVPMNPVRIYAGERGEGDNVEKLAVFISEFQPPSPLIKPIAKTIIDWAQDQRADLLISPEGLVIEEGDDGEEGEDGSGESEKDIVYGLGSTPGAVERFRQAGLEPFTDGVITGVAGVLLNEGRMRDFDVLTILAEASSEYPDARAAANVVNVIGKVLTGLDIDYRPLLEEAVRMEAQLKAIRDKSKMTAHSEKIPPRPSMYG